VKLLKIVGRKRSMAIGRELEIRRTLSPSHLYSSAFVVVKRRNGDDVPAHFTLIGAGWGHGVGLCQIGAAVMGARGYAHEAILRHYFPGTRVERIY
jgi:SpoIID/LytB domain protein